MMAVRVHDLVPNRVLVTRESARLLGTVLASALAEGGGQVELDFSSIDGLTPSFLDETLRIIEERIGQGDATRLSIQITRAPTRLSSKFAAVGRTHGLKISELEDQTWLITPAASDD